MNPCQHPIVFLKDVSFSNLSSILDFMYHGEVNVSHTELATFLKTAEALRVRGLAEDDKRRVSNAKFINDIYYSSVLTASNIIRKDMFILLLMMFKRWTCLEFDP